MTTAYYLKKRTTKKACHRASFQTARVRRLVRRNHRGELAPQTRNVSLPRSSPQFKEIPSCQLYGMIKEYRQLSAYTLRIISYRRGVVNRNKNIQEDVKMML